MFFPKDFTKFAHLVVGGILYLGTGARDYADEIVAGSTVTLSVTVDGTPPFSYQWQKDGTAIAGATAAKYAITNLQKSDTGTYVVLISNSAGAVTSPAATLTMQAPRNETVTTDVLPTTPITPTTPAATYESAPSSTTQIATAGHEVSFTATGTSATSSGQWQSSSDGGSSWSNLSNDTHYHGVTTGTLVVTDVTTGFNGYKFRYLAASGYNNVVTLEVAVALLPFPVGITADGAGNLYVSDTSSDTIQKISPSGVVTLLAGYSGQTGTTDADGSSARFNDPSGLSSAYDGTLLVCDNANGTIRRITIDGKVRTLAGSTTSRGNSDGSGSAATFSSPLGVCQDTGGNLYVADALNNTVRRITPAGQVTTLAGSSGIAGLADGTGSSARFNHPTGIAVDNAGNVYVADTMNNTVRKITSAGAVSTLAGLAGISGIQDGAGNGALFNNPGGLAVDSSGTIYVADTGNSTIRKIAPDGSVSTIAGLPGVAGLMDGTGADAWFNQPKSLVVDASGILYVADTGNAAIRKVSITGTVSTLALSAGAAPATSPTNGTETVVPNNVAVPSAPAPQSVSSGGSAGGGSGGGTMNSWFVSGVFLIGLVRWYSSTRRNRQS